MNKKHLPLIAIGLFVIVVILVFILAANKMSSERKAEELRYERAKQISDEYYSAHPMTPSGQTIRYRDNNGYESEMKITDDGMKMKDNNGYESTITFE